MNCFYHLIFMAVTYKESTFFIFARCDSLNLKVSQIGSQNWCNILYNAQFQITVLVQYGSGWSRFY